MLYNYRATTPDGKEQTGNIEASSIDGAINSIQRRGLVIISIDPAGEKHFWQRSLVLSDHFSQKDVVILSRQIATLFEAQVPVLNAFELMSSQTDNAFLRTVLSNVTDEIRGGVRISAAMSKYPRVFSNFYVQMVKAGEESGKLSETFNYLADYLERAYEITRKARGALVYPVMVITVFIAVIILMMVVVIPQLSGILLESGQELPIYTRLIIWTSNFFVNFGWILLVLLIIGIIFIVPYLRRPTGKALLDEFLLSVPYVGDLFERLYLSRISDNIDTMLSSGIAMLRALEITGDVVGSAVYQRIFSEVVENVKGGSQLSEAFSRHPEQIPAIMVQMTKIGEETGKLGFVLKTMSRFYKKEVDRTVDTLVSLIEPFMILFLGLGVGIMLAGVLLPIYSLSSAI